MNKPTEILYPRGEAKIHLVTSKSKKSLAKRIKAFEDSLEYKEYLLLKSKLSDALSAESRFTCWRCKKEGKTEDMTLYRFISYSNTMDNDRYEDHNLVCPCGAFSYVKKLTFPVKNMEDIYE